MSAVRDGQHFSINCVTAVIFIYHLHADHAVNSFTTVDVILAEMREEAEYIKSISKTGACVYCGTVLYVAEVGSI